MPELINKSEFEREINTLNLVNQNIPISMTNQNCFNIQYVKDHPFIDHNNINGNVVDFNLITSNNIDLTSNNESILNKKYNLNSMYQTNVLQTLGLLHHFVIHLIILAIRF